MVFQAMVYSYLVTVSLLWISVATGQQNHGNTGKGDGVAMETVSIAQAILEGDAVLDDFYVRYATTPIVDLVFVLDRSGSVPRKGWAAIVRFLYDTLQHFTVDRDNTRVAVVTYSSDVTVDINDLDPKNDGNKCTLHSRIEALLENKIPYGYTATHDALYEAFRILVNSRPDAKKAVLVLTDGESNIGPPPIRATHDILSLEWNADWNETAMGPQVEIYAFGIQDAFLPELNSIASPLPNHTFLIPTFEAFEDFARKLHGGKQEETWIPVTYTECQASCSGEHANCMCGARRGQYACVCDPGYERIGITCKACDRGYYKAGHTLSMCLACPVNTTTDHTMSTRQEDCKLLPGMRDCPPIAEVENGWSFYVSGHQKDEVPPSEEPCVDVRNGNSCHYKCQEGYWMQGSPIMHCNRSGLWEGTPPNCTIIDCKDPNSLDWELGNTSLILVNGTTTYNSVIVATCADNTVAIGQTTWTCDRHGKWTKPWNFFCAVIECPPLPKVPYSTSYPETCNRHRQSYGTNCTVTCNDGFELVGPENVSCDFRRRALWDTQTEEWPWCRDVKPPEIVCLSDLELIVMNWEDNSTYVHTEPSDALASDNSHNVSQWITGVPPGGIFSIGTRVVRYYANDSSGLMSQCERKITVKAKQVKTEWCPEDIMVEMTDVGGMEVTWEDPVFLDSMDHKLPFSCHPNKGLFKVGNFSVDCVDSRYHEAKCQFNVVVMPPECPLPHPDKLPANGAVICGKTSDVRHPKWCRVHCEEGYELRSNYVILDENHKFECDMGGRWRGLENGWPKCRKSRRPDKPTMMGEMHIGYEGVCADDKEAIMSGFIDTVMALLTLPEQPCSEDVQCTVSDVEVYCQDGRTRRSASTGGKTILAFTMYTYLENITEDTVTSEQQKKLANILGNAFYEIEDLFWDGTQQLNINNNTVNFSRIDVVEDTTFKELNCSQIIEEASLIYFGCLSCAAGSYFVNESCVDCPAGTYQPVGGAYDCEQCPQETTSPTGAVSKCQCLPPSELTTTSPDTDNSTKTLTYTTTNPCYLCQVQLENCSDPSVCEPYCVQGECNEMTDWVSCTCDTGYTGTRCDVIIDVCDDVECFNGGTCVPCEECKNNVACVCVEGFTGDLCEAVTQQCDDDSCLHGYCVDHHDNHSCICEDGWIGDRCDRMQTDCNPEFCVHGNCSLSYGHITCHCLPGYTGERCEYLDDPCVSVLCEDGGVCVTSEGGGPTCQCEPGFIGDFCEIEACSNFSCDHNGSCLLVGGQPLCKCEADFTGAHCEEESSGDFDLVFSAGHIDDFVSLRLVDSPLQEVTACLWLRTRDVLHYGTLFSYAAQSNWLNTGDVDVFTLQNYGKLKLLVNGEAVETDVVLNDGFWHHLCVTWTQHHGQWAIYVNGTASQSGSNLAEQTYIEPGGYFVIGQNQETIGDGFTQRDAFIGEMHQLNVYSTHFSAENVSALYSLGCEQEAGDVITWTHVLGHVTGDVTVRQTSWCLDENECLVAGACPDHLVCEDVRGGPVTCVADPCNRLTCLHGGVCLSSHDGGEHRATCYCPPGFTGETCDVEIPSKASCHKTTCHNGGSCTFNGSCMCVSGFSGVLCEINTSPCLSEPCANAGSCLPSPTGYNCSCPYPWTGSTCQTRITNLGCLPNPCLNDGECQEEPGSDQGYVCKCQNEHAGANCETNVCLTQQCRNGGTCIVTGSTSFDCACPIGYSGLYCDLVSTIEKTTIATTPPDNCIGVNCRNGGQCVSEQNGFRCKCTLEFYGTYCGKPRTVYEHTYDIQVTLNTEYTPALMRNETFKQKFVNVIHKLYQPELKQSEIEVVIEKISRGSVIVDFQIIHKNYSGAESPSAKTIEQILMRQLMTGKLGPWRTDLDRFQFEMQTSTRVAGPTVWLTCVIVVLVVILTLTVACICYRKRKMEKNKPMRMNNVPDRAQFRIKNNTQGAGKTPPSPTVQIRMGAGNNEDVYCEPYSISPEVGPRFPSKRGLDINQTWGSRQSVPLPPPPSGERPPRHQTPPPPYSKSMKVDNANINPTLASKCSSKEVLYITPLAEDEQTPPAKPDIEQQYLTPRLPPREAPKPLNKEEIENLENEAIYLHPRTDEMERSEDMDQVEEDAYLMPQSTQTGDQLIPSDHESEDERVAEHTRVYANDPGIVDSKL